MIGYLAKGFRAGPVLRAMRKTRRATRTLAAQTLNRQARQYRTRMGRAMNAETGAGRVGRMRRRILLPRRGKANARRLVASTLSLYEICPVRWFKGTPPGRLEEVPNTTASRARTLTVANLGSIAYPLRERIMAQLGREFAPEYHRRLRVSLRRIWGRATGARGIGQIVRGAAGRVTTSPRDILRGAAGRLITRPQDIMRRLRA